MPQPGTLVTSNDTSADRMVAPAGITPVKSHWNKLRLRVPEQETVYRDQLSQIYA